MKLTRLTVGVATLTALSIGAAPAGAGTTPQGNRSLASVLTADGNRFDTNWYDYDIVTEAVLAVLAAKPNSPVKVLTDGNVPLTAFIPNDRAFQMLVADVSGRWISSESKVFHAVASLGIDKVEAILLYHVVPGATITKADAVNANGAQLRTALGPTIGVRVYDRNIPLVMLRDKDPNDINPFLNPRALDISKGNKQIAHGIVFVLRPVDL